MAISKFLCMNYYTCPKCGYAIRSGVTNGSTACPGCKCNVRISNGQVVGTN